MNEMPWVRFFPSDWLGGTRGMSASEAGVYINLLAMMYERGEPIAEDHAKLARLSGTSNSAFRKTLERLVSDGKIIRQEGGLWNDRVEKEQVYRSEKSAVGKQAAEKRWRKNEENQGPGDAAAMRTQCQGNANQKPEARSQKEKETPTALPTPDDRYVFAASTIKLTGKDLEKWRQAFPHISLEAELWALDEWAGEQGGNWFHAVSNALAKKERQATERINMARLDREAGPSRRAVPDPRI